MAKWGKGDPRWIVEERPDATNVNNWHWTEKNASQWSKDKIKDLFQNIVVEDDKGLCIIKEVTKVEGEASANNRKAKLIFFYEWSIVMDWIGSVTGGLDELEGKVEIPNLSEEHSPDEVDIIITCKTSSTEADVLLEIMRRKGVHILRDKISRYINELREEFTVGMILPSKDGTVNQNSCQNVVKPEKQLKTEKKSDSGSSEASVKKLDTGVSISATKLTLRESFKCTAEEFYSVLTVKEMVNAFTREVCMVDPVKGGAFEVLGGNITGHFTNLIPNKKLAMKWRLSGWPDGHFSDVTIDIDQKEGTTEVTMTQSGIPANDVERTKVGWSHYYWEAIKKTFGFGATLF